MNDLISREYMKSLGATCIASRSKDGTLFPIVAIDELPPAEQPKERCVATITLSEKDLERIVKEQAEEIKELVPQKGEWIWYDDIYDLEKEYICSECRCYALKKDGNQIRSNFCPNCRCDMREGD